MTLRGAVVVPSAPLLVPALAGGGAGADEELRGCCRAAVRELVDSPEGELVVVGAAAGTQEVTGTWDWAGLGVRQRGDVAAPALPLALGIGAWLLDTVDPYLPRSYQAVASTAGAEECAALGRRLAAHRDLRLLVVGDGTARRRETGPGHLHPRAEAFDSAAEAALRAGDPEALLALPAGLGHELLADGRAAWQVLAGAASGRAWRGQVDWAQAPYGVCYLVARWWPPGRGSG